MYGGAGVSKDSWLKKLLLAHNPLSVDIQVPRDPKVDAEVEAEDERSATFRIETVADREAWRNGSITWNSREKNSIR